ncbi:MAG: FG-GAP repeat domain-containing protein [Candidatus Rokuibacteriota bacterium]
MTKHPWLAVAALVVVSAVPAVPTHAADIPFTRIVIAPVPPDGPDCKTVGDLDGDGFPDVIVASSIDGGLHWYRYPSWTKQTIRATGGWTTDMQAGDVDGDGDLDLVLPNTAGALVWYRNPRPTGDPAATPWAEVPIGADGAHTHHDLEVGDVNGDGKLDVVSRRHGGGATYVWFQSTPASWVMAVVGEDPGEGTALGDLDGDGDLDIAQNGFWLENPLPGGNPLEPWPRHPIESAWESLFVGVLVADVNGDGRNDVVLAPSESSDGRFVWYEAADPVAGPWTEHEIDPSVSYFHTFKAADVDGDGDLDVVTAEMHQSSDPDEVSVYRNEGGGLAWTQQVVATTGSHNLRIADIDADGDVDIVGVNWLETAADGAAVTLWRNLLTSVGPVLELTLADATLGPGETLRVSAAVENPGPAVVVDVLFGVLLPPAALACPAGLAVAFLVNGFAAVETGCVTGVPSPLPALARAVGLPAGLPRTDAPDLFTTALPAAIPPGDYTVFLALVDPVSGSLLAVATATFTVPT